MRSKMIFSVLALLLMLSPLTSSQKANANEIEYGRCDITIDANVHDFFNMAQATGDCRGYVEGYFDPDGNFALFGATYDLTYNGAVHEFTLPDTTLDYIWYKLYVKTVPLKKPDPKPDPEPEQKPKPKPKPQEPKETKPKDTPKESKPKENTVKPKDSNKNSGESSNSNNKSDNNKQTSSSTSSSSSNQSNQNSKSNTSNSSSTNNSNNDKNVSNEEKTDVQEEVEEEVEEEKELKDWTINEIQEAGLELQCDEENRGFVEYEGERRELKSFETSLLGGCDKEIEEDEHEEASENDDETEVKPDEDTEGLNKGLNKGIVIAAIGLVILTLAGLFYFHPKGKAFYESLVNSVIKVFKRK